MVLSTLKMLNKHFLVNKLMLNAFPRNNIQATLSEEGMWQTSFAKFLLVGISFVVVAYLCICLYWFEIGNYLCCRSPILYSSTTRYFLPTIIYLTIK